MTWREDRAEKGWQRGAQTSDNILEVNHLNLYLGKGKSPPVQILSDVSFAIRRGEVAGLIGETGCGKTLTARSIIGLLPNDATLKGEILYDGENIAAYDEASLLGLRRREIALIPQNPMTSLDPLFTVKQQMFDTLGRAPSYSEKLELCTGVLEKVELDPERVLRSHPYELSGGMLQRVLIALALIRKPKLIIADEITTALDLITQIKILALIKKLKVEENIAMLVVTHDMKVVKSLCDTIAVMYVGRIIERGDAADVLQNTRHPYTEALMSSIPTIGRTDLVPIEGIVPSFDQLPAGCRFCQRCPYKFLECEREDPLLNQIGRSMVACHLYSADMKQHD